MAVTRKDMLNALRPSLDKLFSDEYAKWGKRKVCEVIQRGDTYDVLEHSVDEPDDIVIATGLSFDEVTALYKLTDKEWKWVV
jgi:hypothetical protein